MKRPAVAPRTRKPCRRPDLGKPREVWTWKKAAHRGEPQVRVSTKETAP